MVPIYDHGAGYPPVEQATITKDQFNVGEVNMGKRKNLKFGVLFSPAFFDEEIGLEQFQNAPLPVEEMKRFGIMASIIRQDLIGRAQTMELSLKGTELEDDVYNVFLTKKLYRNIESPYPKM